MISVWKITLLSDVELKASCIMQDVNCDRLDVGRNGWSDIHELILYRLGCDVKDRVRFHSCLVAVTPQ